MRDFLKVSLGLTFAFFPNMRVLGDLPKIAITWSIYYLEDNVISARALLRILSEGYFLGDILKFPLDPPLHFFRKCGFFMTLRKLPYLGYSGTFRAAFCAKIFSSLCTLTAY